MVDVVVLVINIVVLVINNVVLLRNTPRVNNQFYLGWREVKE